MQYASIKRNQTKSFEHLKDSIEIIVFHFARFRMTLTYCWSPCAWCLSVSIYLRTCCTSPSQCQAGFSDPEICEHFARLPAPMANSMSVHQSKLSLESSIPCCCFMEHGLVHHHPASSIFHISLFVLHPSYSVFIANNISNIATDTDRGRTMLMIDMSKLSMHIIKSQFLLSTS